MYHNRIPHSSRPLEDLLNGEMQLGYSHHPQRAGIRWAGHDAQPETVVRIAEVCDSFILTWTDLFQIGTPRDLGLTDLLANYIKPGKQYEYRMDFMYPNSVFLIEKGGVNALMVDLDGSIVHAPDTPKAIKNVHVITNYQTEYEPFRWASGLDAQANDAIIVSPQRTIRLAPAHTPHRGRVSPGPPRLPDPRLPQAPGRLRRHLSLAQPLWETPPSPHQPHRPLPAQQGSLERPPHGWPQRQRSLPHIHRRARPPYALG